jgi:pentatricopeptide repeat protein
VQAFDTQTLDASCLLIPMYGLLPFDDPRVRGTIDRIYDELTENGLVYRYRASDGLPGKEGAFVLCTFWLIDALAFSGRLDEAHDLFERMLARTNHLGLLSEQLDPRSGAFLGNFPQAFSHLGMIDTALHLSYLSGRDVPMLHPEPRRTRVFDSP